MKRTLTIHRALAELKLIDAKIEKQLDTQLSIISWMDANKIVDGITKEADFITNAKSSMQSIEGLISNREVIKSAITKSNNTTLVKVGEKEMTVIDAVNYRAIIAIKKRLLSKLVTKHSNATDRVLRHNAKVDDNSLALAKEALKKETVNIGDTDVAAIIKPYKDINYLTLCDPINSKEKIEALHDEIISFEAEIDATLSESNAITQIEI